MRKPRKPDKNYPKWIIVHNSGGIVADPYWDSSVLTAEKISEAHEQRWPYFYSEMTEEGEGEIVA